ncbi:thioesterase family protein [Virgibacillus sp. C22-A2]|uniref:Thioesterase family protein n=1 Tax=Virgibacillus tibetensis TaxID=3042313 RepID=A0ABU6KEQ4_9BACI|nr:thioesterase family protein [Virgibacillus sp. C22-A2]
MADQPFLYQDHVQSDWVDYNGHMNDAAYAKVFSLAADRLIEFIGLDAEARNHYSYTIFTLETHLSYLQEAHKDEQLLVDLQLMDVDAKRLHVFFTMKNANHDVIATSEQMLMGMDTKQGRPAAFPKPVTEIIEKIWNEHKQLETPAQAGRRIGIKR